MYICVFQCVCMYRYVCACMCMHGCMHVYVYSCACMGVCMHRYMCISVHACVYVSVQTHYLDINDSLSHLEVGVLLSPRVGTSLRTRSHLKAFCPFLHQTVFLLLRFCIAPVIRKSEPDQEEGSPASPLCHPVPRTEVLSWCSHIVCFPLLPSENYPKLRADLLRPLLLHFLPELFHFRSHLGPPHLDLCVRWRGSSSLSPPHMGVFSPGPSFPPSVLEASLSGTNLPQKRVLISGLSSLLRL